MIFVTVGTHYQGFERLVRKMDEIASRIDEEVIIQIGYTKYEPKNAKWFRFLEKEEEIIRLYKEASIVVSHAGAGTLLTVLSLGKPLVIVPRLKKFREHIDDQQLELAEALERSGRAIAVYNIRMLELAIKRAMSMRLKPIHRSRRLSNFIREHLRGLAE